MASVKGILAGVRAEVASRAGRGQEKTAADVGLLDSIPTEQMDQMADSLGELADKQAGVDRILEIQAGADAEMASPEKQAQILDEMGKVATQQAMRELGLVPGHSTLLHLIDKNPAAKLAQYGMAAATRMIATAMDVALDPHKYHGGGAK